MTALLPTGTQHVLRSDRVEAVVTQVGGGLRSLRVDGVDVVVPFPAEAPRPVFRGAVLAPWPNRVGHGRWTWDGRPQQLALTEPERGGALHGLVCHLPFSTLDESETAVSLRAVLWPQPGWPGLLELTVGYHLEGDGLTWTLDVRNLGDRRVPYGCSVHPYLLASGKLDDASLRLCAGTVLDVDPDSLLPTGRREVASTVFDLAAGRELRGVVLDHAFTDVRADEDGTARAVLTGPDGAATVMEWDPVALPWVQVCTADRPEPHLHRAGLAVEPMTCPPDALRSGTGLVHLAPGERHSAR